jgi:hypothetical protein
MRDLVSTYRPLGSEFDDFLFAEVGVQQNGMRLSLASGLIRLGLDPWTEAARLATLPAGAAAAALTALISRMPDLEVGAAEDPGLPAGLVALLRSSASSGARPRPSPMQSGPSLLQGLWREWRRPFKINMTAVAVVAVIVPIILTAWKLWAG